MFKKEKKFKMGYYREQSRIRNYWSFRVKTYRGSKPMFKFTYPSGRRLSKNSHFIRTLQKF